MFRLQEDGAFANAELFAGCCAVAQAGRELGRCQWCGGEVVDAGIVLVSLEFVLLGVLRGVQAGPGLAVGGDVLARILRM